MTAQPNPLTELRSLERCHEQGTDEHEQSIAHSCSSANRFVAVCHFICWIRAKVSVAITPQFYRHLATHASVGSELSEHFVSSAVLKTPPVALFKYEFLLKFWGRRGR